MQLKDKKNQGCRFKFVEDQELYPDLEYVLTNNNNLVQIGPLAEYTDSLMEYESPLWELEIILTEREKTNV